MKPIKLVFILLICSFCSGNLYAQGLKAFKLPNGLNVYVWEDYTVPDVYGIVAVNVGSKEDPEQYTGLAHYLEHMMFKGTETIGALDWEKEKPIYEQIIAKYDEMAKQTDPVQRGVISKEINKLTQEAAKYNLSNEFANLTQGMGGEGLNAGTNLDYTIYYNSFPPGEIYKWLELNSERLINPIFRSFQPELETVYEEYNRAQDQQGRRIYEFVQGNVYPGHPYSRPIIGLPDHLKNPQLSQLIQFYNTWYVPQNMALILVGNIKTSEIVSVIKEKFGRLENRPLPERKQYSEAPLKGRKEINSKLSPIPQVVLAFPGITASSTDDIALDICTSILSNSSRTGLLDKLMLDGDLMGVNASVESLKERGTIKIGAIPYYDPNQRRFESLGATEKTLLKEVKKLQEGKFEDWLVQSIKNEMIRRHDLMMESPSDKAKVLSYFFLDGRDMGELLEYKEMVTSVTIDQIKTVAKKYFGSDYIALFLNEGKPSKSEKLEKPNYDPIQPVRGAKSNYAKAFEFLPVKHAGATYANMNDVQVKSINDRSKLYYMKNSENDIFTLTMKFGVGTEKMPKLELATSLMNNAGIMGQLKSQEVKQEFSNLGATCEYSVNGSYLYVTMNGFEVNLQESCNLLTRQVLLPQLDEKQMDNLKGSYSQQRRIEKTSTEELASALKEYLLYQNKSDYLDRLTLEEIEKLTISDLTGEFQRATDYEAQIHYVGSMPLESVYDVLSKNLPLKQGEKESTSPEVKERMSYTENTVLFLPNSDAQQSTIYFYIQGDEYKKEIDTDKNVFNEYFSGGFSGLVAQEIREYRSMAYVSGGYYVSPLVENKKGFFLGSLGTQADKTLDAVAVYMDLINNMPQYPDRLNNIKTFMKETALVDKPNFRDASQVYESWKLRGYTKSPAETNMTKIDGLSFENIEKFYNANIKGRPVTIAIVGDPKMIDLKALEKYGKVVKLSTSKLFSEK